MPSAPAATAMCQIRSAPIELSTADRRHRDHVHGLDGDDDAALIDAVGGDATDQHERHQAGAKARRDQRQRRRIVVQRDHLQRHHDGPHALGEDRHRQRADQQAVLAEPERCEHAPAAGALHRLLLDVELRTHPSMVADRPLAESNDFPRRANRRARPRDRRRATTHSHFRCVSVDLATVGRRALSRR